MCHLLGLSGIPAREEMFSTPICGKVHERPKSDLVKSLDSVKQRGLAIKSLELHLNNRVAVLHLNLEDMRAGDPGEAANYGLMVKGVEVAVLLKEQEPNRYRISLRSRDTVDVSAVASIFGGGGHNRAAGLRLEGEAADIIDKILAETGRQLDRGPSCT